MNLYLILLNTSLLAPVCTAPPAQANSFMIFKGGDELLGEAPGNPARQLFREGRRMQRSGRLDEAQQHYEAAIRENPLYTDAYLALAALYQQQQQPEPAKQQLQTLLRQFPAQREALAMLAALHYEQQAWEDALTCAFRAQELGEPHMHRIIGLSYGFLDHPAEAVQALEKAHREKKLEGEELCRLARLYAQLENYQKSVQYYEESLKAGSNPREVYYELGMMYFNMKNYKNAAGAFEQAARSGRPVDADLYLNLGMAHLRQADYDNAIQHLQTALSLRPKDIQIMLSLANACYNKQDYRQAATQWNKILVMQPQNAFAMFMLGKSYMGCGELAKGQAICDQALKISN
ncbi:tetratricopeptide repeat protein [Chitinophaga sp.]|uniref:tetratricopeptide repeat protein n=1 Tax=Chitinophaga sp. TaxID=1869181 RepID=UPI0031DEEB05